MKYLHTILLMAMVCSLFSACTEKKEAPKEDPNTEVIDSLKRVIEQKDNEVADVLNTINEIQEGFRSITAAEGRVTLAKSGEGADHAEQLNSDIRFIAEQMQHQRELIEKLQQQARQSTSNADLLRTTIEGLTTELETKNRELQQLRAELEQKDVRINELGSTITSLNDDVSNLRKESQQLSTTVSSQDKQLNTAWYAFGTKKELKDNRILEDGDVLRSNFNKSYFTKVDIRVDREIKLYSKSAKVLTSHPTSSFTLQQDASKQYVLRITDPTAFWSTSKYLVIQVK